MLVYRLQVVAPAVAVLVDPLVLRVPPRVLRNEERHGTTEKAGLAELNFEGATDRREGAPSS